MNADALTYVLITPARNEADVIRRTLESVVAQTTLPRRWVIVDDGSTDATCEIVREYASAHDWIELVSLGRRAGRKADAFNAGYQRLRSVDYDVIANLDADLSFEAGFFSFLLDKFRELPNLGVAGTMVIEDGAAYYDYRFTNIAHVTGGCQLFRKECLDALDGYAVVDRGVDTIAVTTARMLGWQTRTFLEKAWVHRRKMGSARRPLGGGGRWMDFGQRDQLLGNPPVWEMVRVAYQMTRPPFVIRGALIGAGYGLAAVRRQQSVMPADVRKFLAAERKRRIGEALARLNPLRARAAAPDDVAELSLEESLFRLGAWVEARQYKGYEPFDGLSSHLRPLTLGVPLLERGLQQLGRRSPVNLRPLLGIRPLESTKGRGYMARGYLARWRQTQAEEDRVKAVRSLEWLRQNTSPLYQDCSWGNHFDFVSRAGRYRKHESIIVWTSHIGQAFLDAYEDLGDARYLDVARSVCDWILKLPRERTSAGDCLSYLAGRQLSIHNANLLGAGMLARTARHTGAGELVDVARSAVRYSCAAQRSDGSWHYAEAPAYRWIDSFHTGYNLDSILCYEQATGDTTFAGQLDLGFRFFREHFFEADGTPKYFHNRTYPIDIQCAAQAIETFATFSGREPEALADAQRVARWTIRNMQDPSGYFYYRKSGRFVSKIPMLHWGQATMFRALALLSLKLTPGARRGVETIAGHPA